MGSFSTDLSQFAKKTNQTVDSAVREVVMELASEVNLRSPVGKPAIWQHPESAPHGYIGGHFRANNQYKFGSLPMGEVDGVDADGSRTVEAIRAGVYSAPAAGVHYIANNVPYAMSLENGHSRVQAPLGIYKLAMMSIVGKLNSIVRRLAR